MPAKGIHRRLPINVTAALINRFNEAVDKGEPGECWNWIRSFRNGYGAIKHEGRVLSAHRVAYVIANGEPGDGLLVTHSCDNRACCNPAHLVAGTPKDNAREMRERIECNQPRGEQVPNAKLCEQTVSRIWALRRTGLGAVRIARELSISTRAVRSVIEGVSWKHMTPSWAKK